MLRSPALQEKAKQWGLKFITIRDLQNYRKRHEVLVDRVTVTKMPTRYGDFLAYGYVNKLNGQHHVALVKGEIGDAQNLPRSRLRAGGSSSTCARKAGGLA